MTVKRQIRQYLAIIIGQALTLILLGFWMDGLQIHSVGGAIVIAVTFVIFQFVYWWLFVNFFSKLPVWLYPVTTFVLSGGIFMILGNLVPGIIITSFKTAIWVTMILSSVSAALGGFISLDIDFQFDKHVIHRLVQIHGNPIKTDAPGFLFLEIDGLSEENFRRALEKGRMPTLKNWIERGTHKIIGWETDYTSQTGASQAGIMLGNNSNIPAYRWWDRNLERIIKSGSAADAALIERNLSNGRGLLSEGGASRGNMFSGDAAESLFTFSTLHDRSRNTGPGFYLSLINPFMIARLVTRFILRVLKEWCQALVQKVSKNRLKVRARSPQYAFLRAAVGPVLQDLTTHITISDVLRGIPAVYAQFTEFDDLAHFAGEDSAEALETLEEIDRFISRIERALLNAPRPYYTIVLSDHGQSSGPSFRSAYRLSLEQLVRGFINLDSQVIAANDTDESWDKINAFVNESINPDTGATRVLRTMLRSKTRNGLVSFGPDRFDIGTQPEPKKGDDSRLIVLASGCAGLIYFADSKKRLTYEAIQDRCPDLILGLIGHPGIGFVLVHSQENGDIVMGREGIYFLDQDICEGKNPLADYSDNAAGLLRRESSFDNCPDILVNASFDPASGMISSFENQVSHHGGLGGKQSYPFILHPADLPADDTSPVGAIEVNRLFTRWRHSIQ